MQAREVAVHRINNFSFPVTCFKGVCTSVNFQDELWASAYYASLPW